jgi:hypothetical protein
MLGGACNQEVSDSVGSSLDVEQGESSLEESHQSDNMVEDVEVIVPTN